MSTQRTLLYRGELIDKINEMIRNKIDDPEDFSSCYVKDVQPHPPDSSGCNWTLGPGEPRDHERGSAEARRQVKGVIEEARKLYNLDEDTQ